MKKNNFLRIAVIALFLIAIGTNNVFCQIQRQVNESTLTKTTYAIPDYVDESELSDLDWGYLLRDDDDLEECMEYIIKGDTLTIVHYDPKLPRWERDYQYEMGKSVTSIWGTALYYHDGTEYSRLEDYDPDYILSAEVIETYGIYNQMFEMDEEVLISLLQMQGFQVSKEGDFIVASFGGFVEMAINLVGLIDEMRFFGDEDNPFFAEVGNKLTSVTRTEYTRVNGYIVPIKEIRIHYSTLPSGIPYEITDTTSYLFYQVIKNGNTLVKTGNETLFEDCRNSVADLTGIKEMQQTALKIYPNPAKEQITVSMPFNGNENVDIKIFNMLGVNVLSQQAAGEQINVDVRSLPAGVYIVRCGKSDKVTTMRFVKQ